MDKQGQPHKEIWITEIGWSLGEGVNAQEQADLLAQAVVTALTVRERLKVEKVFWFCVKDWGGPGHGLFDVNGKPKPALTAYQAVIAELGSAHYLGPCKTPPGVRGHVFNRGGEPVLAVWAPSVATRNNLELKASAPQLALRNIGNQVHNVPVRKGMAGIEVSHAPLFINGLKLAELDMKPWPRLHLPRQPLPRQLPRDVWVSVVPSFTSARPVLVLGTSNAMEVRVHNDSPAPAQGSLQLELTSDSRLLAEGRVPFEAAPGTLTTVSWHHTLPWRKDQAGKLARLRVRGAANGASIAPLDLPVRLVRGKGIEFAANSPIEGQYLHQAGKSGCGDSIRFGSEFTYRFDLRHMQSGQLRINVGANGANPWSVLLSRDDKNYVEERSGRSWPSWQSVALDHYLGGREASSAMVYVKIRGTDCQVREVVVEAGAENSP